LLRFHLARNLLTTAAAFLRIVSARRGHFRLESGHHGGLWVDLDALFAEPRMIDPFVTALARRLRQYDVSMVCGPLLGGAFLAQLLARSLSTQFCFTQRSIPTEPTGMYQVRYRLPPAFAARVRDKRVAIVDDAMSAGSALRGTHKELEAHGATPVVAGALLVLGATGVDFFTELGLPVEAVATQDYELWVPADCPLCATGVPLEDVATKLLLG
jgi:orotate phosphoribosyltransferase